MDDPLSYLFGLEFFGIKFGLANMRALVGRLGHPERAFRTIHVAGTNGKGSVTAMVDAALRAAGHRSARYTSPHLVDIAERFTIDGTPVSHEALAAEIATVRTAIEGLLKDEVLHTHPTFFEVTTAVAFELFRRARVDLAVVEVGLGGRLDATNVVEPALTAITSIAFDHEQYLGSTLEAIATEKAGIIKTHVPLVLGELPPDARDAIERVAAEQHATVIHASDGVTVTASASESGLPGTTRIRLRTAMRDYGELVLGLRGAHQVRNALVAVSMLEQLDRAGIGVPASAVAAGLAHPGWPGRLEERRLADGRELLLDAAHNPAGAAALASYLRDSRFGRVPLVFAAMRDKDINGMLRALLPEVASVVMTQASNRRSADPVVLAEQARRIAPGVSVSVLASPSAALDAAWQQSPRIIVAGSIFLLGDVLGRLGPS